MKALLYTREGKIKEREVPWGTYAFRLKRRIEPTTFHYSTFRLSNDPPSNGIGHYVEDGVSSNWFNQRSDEARKKHNNSYADEMLYIAHRMEQPTFKQHNPTLELEDELTLQEKFGIQSKHETEQKLLELEQQKMAIANHQAEDQAKQQIIQMINAGELLTPSLLGSFMGKVGSLVTQTNQINPNWYGDPYEQIQYEGKAVAIDKYSNHANESSMEIKTVTVKEAAPEPEIVGEPKKRFIDFGKKEDAKD